MKSRTNIIDLRGTKVSNKETSRRKDLEEKEPRAREKDEEERERERERERGREREKERTDARKILFFKSEKDPE